MSVTSSASTLLPYSDSAMTSLEEASASSLSGTPDAERSISYYKSQYEQLEAELADFQSSSKELEAELEKDVEAAERRERQLQEKVEGLRYEVEEWKVRRLVLPVPTLGKSIQFDDYWYRWS